MNDAVVNQALTQGWEAGVVAFFVLGAMTLFAWIFRFQILRSEEREKLLWATATERELRLSKRIDDLEEFINVTLATRIENNTLAMQQLTKSIDVLNEMMSRRPCLLPTELLAKLTRE